MNDDNLEKKLLFTSANIHFFSEKFGFFAEKIYICTQLLTKYRYF